MMESVASSLLRTRSAGEGVCDWAGVNFGTRKMANTKLATMDFLIVVARFMVGSPQRRSDVRGYCKGVLGLWGCVDGEKLKSRKMPEGRQLETLSRTELAHNRNGILVQSINRVIQVAHVGGREFAGEISEGGAKLREAGESGLANDGDGVVGRKVVAVVGEGDNVDLVIEEGAVDEAEVHHVRLPGEVEAVQIAQGAEAVGALEEFVADAGAPLRGDGSDI